MQQGTVVMVIDGAPLAGRIPHPDQSKVAGNPGFAVMSGGAAGYDCALAGKLHLAGSGGRVEPRPQHDGYRLFHWSHDPEDQWETGRAYADWIAEQGRNLG